MKSSPSSEPAGLSGQTQQQFLTLPVNEIEPYWRNPRKISEEAVNALAESLRRYGYLQPIVVDAKHVIIIGHTRYAAMRRLGLTEISVAVDTTLTEMQVKELRAIDNKVSEFTSWDFEKLLGEVETLDANQMRSFFPEIVGDVQMETIEVDVTPGGIGDGTPGSGVSDEVEFICPSCFHGWTKHITVTEIQNGLVEA